MRFSFYADPMFDNLRDDPRWNEFLVSVGIDPEKILLIEFDPEIPVAANDR